MGSRNPTQSGTTNPSLLCLKCRRAGHTVDKCSSSRWRSELGWLYSRERKEMDFGNASSTSEQELCKRCRDLDVLQLLHEEIPWKSTSDLNKAARNGIEGFRSLGKTGSVEFWKDCPFCRCLFALTPNPSSSTQDILLIPSWTMSRLAGETDTVTETDEYRQFAKCLLVALNPSPMSLEFSVRAHRGDAICILEGDDSDPAITLGGRQITPHHLNTDIIEEWISTCSRVHGVDCMPAWTRELQDIKLVDVSTRKIVKYPDYSCDYIALSYVWGGVAQQSYRLGSFLGKLPQTIEDAIDLVRKLGKPYLWVDSLCIDQNDEKDKENQIKKMWSIYRGSYITIIALSGTSADAGLPRLGPNTRAYPQINCSIDGKRLVGLMPTLTQQIWVSPWGQRAWTLQEAVGSPRCLYMSNHQLYFECNLMQCNESLNQTRSWAHQLCADPNSAQEGWLRAKAGAGCLRNPTNEPSRRLLHYGEKLTLYGYRSMTMDIDGLNAFSGILHFLGSWYEEGFFWGLPIADFQWGLLWRSQDPPSRRQGFPTWSWAGWNGALWPGYPSDITNPHKYPVHLHMWKAQAGQLVQFFRKPPDTQDPEISFLNDPITKASRLRSSGPEFDVHRYPRAEETGHLFVEAIVFYFSPDYRRPLIKVRERGRDELFAISIRGVSCRIRIMSTDLEVDRPARQEKQQFILLARDCMKGWVIHYLLLLHPQGDIAVRGTVLELIVPEDYLGVLEELEPRKRRVVLS